MVGPQLHPLMTIVIGSPGQGLPPVSRMMTRIGRSPLGQTGNAVGIELIAGEPHWASAASGPSNEQNRIGRANSRIRAGVRWFFIIMPPCELGCGLRDRVAR